jgi:hypothetical protein
MRLFELRYTTMHIQKVVIPNQPAQSNPSKQGSKMLRYIQSSSVNHCLGS